MPRFINFHVAVIKGLYTDGICICSFPALGSAIEYQVSRKVLLFQLFSFATISIFEKSKLCSLLFACCATLEFGSFTMQAL